MEKKWEKMSNAEFCKLLGLDHEALHKKYETRDDPVGYLQRASTEQQIRNDCLHLAFLNYLKNDLKLKQEEDEYVMTLKEFQECTRQSLHEYFPLGPYNSAFAAYGGNAYLNILTHWEQIKDRIQNPGKEFPEKLRKALSPYHIVTLNSILKDLGYECVTVSFIRKFEGGSGGKTESTFETLCCQ